MSRFVYILLGALFFSGCAKNPEKSVPVHENGKEYPSQEGWDSIYRVTHAGRPQAVIRYGHMTKFDSKATYYFDQGVQVDFFEESGRHSSVLTAERGEYEEQTRDVYGMGNVVIVSDTGVTVLTEKIRWDEKHGKIISDTLATIIQQAGDTIYCQGFESMPDLSKIVLKGTSGKSQRRIDFDRIESEFAEEPKADSVRTSVVQDTLE